MITEKDLIQEIEECQMQPLTDKKVQRLADCYIILDHLFRKTFEDVPNNPYYLGYSEKNQLENTIYITGDTDFFNAINGKDTEKVLKIIQELMDFIQTLHPRVYNQIMAKLSQI